MVFEGGPGDSIQTAMRAFMGIDRRPITQILRQPIKGQVVKKLRGSFGSEMRPHLLEKATHDQLFEELNKEWYP